MFLYQPDSGYCYNSDTLFLYDFIESLSPKGDVLDIGTGCGVLGLLVAKGKTNISLSAVEKQKSFCKLAKINARVNNIELDLMESDFLDIDEEKKYDYVISNPPFYPSGVQKSTNEMLFNARYNVNLPIDQFFQKVVKILKPHSHFIFCYDASQFGDVCVELQKAKMRVVDAVFVYPKIDRDASIVMVHARNNSKSMMKVWKPFIGFEGDSFSKRASEIYKKASTWSVKCQIS